jgi:hypothetical protein
MTCTKNEAVNQRVTTQRLGRDGVVLGFLTLEKNVLSEKDVFRNKYPELGKPVPTHAPHAVRPWNADGAMDSGMYGSVSDPWIISHTPSYSPVFGFGWFFGVVFRGLLATPFVITLSIHRSYSCHGRVFGEIMKLAQ